MIKKKLYPKTTRLGRDRTEVIVTEKLDGSNLTFFKHPETGKLGIGQRNIIYYLDEIEDKESKSIMYKGLKEWLNKHGENLEKQLNKRSAIVGEWLGMGGIKYDNTELNKFNMFAKANVNSDLDMYNINYNADLFIYPFVIQEIPDYIGTAPVVKVLNSFPSVDVMDELYDSYVKKVDRKVEGFCVTDGKIIRKYVRMKRGVLEDHSD